MVKHAVTRRVAYLFAVTLLLCAIVSADTRGPAPQFQATTLDGQSYSNSALSGNVVLLQFFTTWCPVCRRDQPAVDNIAAEFAGDGLVVIAIDDGEPEATVRAFLQAHPRACPVVVNDGHSLAARFGAHSHPHYVVIDRNGNITASASGGGGEPHLRYLLASAGLPSKSTAVETNRRAPSTNASPGPQIINVPPTQSIIAAKPIPKTIFVFANGERLEEDHYVLDATFLHVTAEGRERTIPLSALDIKKTIGLNRQRGIVLKIPANGSEVFVAF